MKKKRASLTDYKVFGEGKKQISIEDTSKPDGQQLRKGQFFVKFPSDLAQFLPNSSLSADQFLQEIGASKYNYAINRLEGKYEGNEHNPALYYRSNNFSLRVLHGSTNTKAIKLSELAEKDLEDENIRGEYQQKVYELMKPVLSVSLFPVNLRIVEDCLASGDTISGLLTLLKTKTKLDPQKVRIDLLVATTQGVRLLQEFAKSNAIELELNIGYLAYCLSENNYITYPANSKYHFVVGDMGDAAKSLGKSYDQIYPWNSFRQDTHGGRNKTATSPGNHFGSDKPTIVYLANGGYLMQAILKNRLGKQIANEIMLSGKRVWDEKRGYGVLIDLLPIDLLV